MMYTYTKTMPLLIHHKMFALKKENKEVRDNVHDVQM